MDDWSINYEIVDKDINSKGVVNLQTVFKDNIWSQVSENARKVEFFGINRTVPAIENSNFTHKRRIRFTNNPFKNLNIATEVVDNIENIKSEAEKILGKCLAHFQLLRLIIIRGSEATFQKTLESYRTNKHGIKERKYKWIEKSKTIEKLLFVGSDGENQYSEFNFGAGEASVIRLVSDAESLPDNSLILIEEIENGLHPVAVKRLVEYFIDVANRKKLQVIFTTHNDHALMPLPTEAIWASIDGKVQQGKLSIEMLRAVSGRIDKRLAVFVEDEFAKFWIEAILREKLCEHLDEIGVYPVSGDGNAVKVHTGHIPNPSIRFHSVCIIDGDSGQAEDLEKRIYRLLGLMPESTVFNSVILNLENNIAFLTVACQRSSDKQEYVGNEIKKVSHTNRDPHLLFNQVGLKIGFVSESIVRGAFLTTWIQENSDEAERVAETIRVALNLPPKNQTD